MDFILNSGNSIAIEWPCSLQRSIKNKLASIAKPIEARQLGNNLPGVIYIQSGCLVSYSTNVTLDASLGLIYGENCWFGIQSIFDQNYSPQVMYESLTPTRLWLFPKNKIERILEEDNEGYKFLFFIAQQIGRLSLQMGSNSLHGLKTRVIYVLLELAMKENEVSLSKIHITQQKLSQIVGISRPRVNEVLQELVSLGDIQLYRGKILIPNLYKLRNRLHKFATMFNDPIKTDKRMFDKT